MADNEEILKSKEKEKKGGHWTEEKDERRLTRDYVLAKMADVKWTTRTFQLILFIDFLFFWLAIVWIPIH